jgi:hypothetical protein
MNYNSLTPLEAYEMLYPIATVSYPLTLTLGLPYNAPFLGGMQYYKYINQYVQLQMVIPQSVPDKYSIMIVMNNAYFIKGTADCSLQSLTYTPVYDYSKGIYYLKISKTGPIVIGTTITFTFQIYINTNSLFTLSAYIDTDDIINSFTASSYKYSGSVQSSGVTTSSFSANFWDSQFGWTDRVVQTTVAGTGRYFAIQIYQNINSLATSANSYIDVYLSPNFLVASSFNQNTDCRFDNTAGTCLMTTVTTPNYVKLTIKATSSYLSGTPNPFAHQTYRTVYIYNIMPTITSSNKNLYPVYITLYQSDVVSPVAYYYYRFLSIMPPLNQLSGLSLTQNSNYYTSTNYYNYPGFIRLQSTIPSQMNFIVQANQKVVIAFYSQYGFTSFSSISNMQPYPCASNIAVSCTYYAGNNGINQLYAWDRVVVTFLTTDYNTTNFHIIIPDTPTFSANFYFYYQTGFYN